MSYSTCVWKLLPYQESCNEVMDLVKGLWLVFLVLVLRLIFIALLSDCKTLCKKMKNTYLNTYQYYILPKHFRTIKAITQPDGEEDDEEVLDLNREDGPVIERADSGVRFDITERRDRDDRMDSTNVHDVLERNVAVEANLIATNDINNQVDSSLSLPQAPRGLGVDAPICVWQHLTDPTRSAHSRTEGVG